MNLNFQKVLTVESYFTGKVLKMWGRPKAQQNIKYNTKRVQGTTSRQGTDIDSEFIRRRERANQNWICVNTVAIQKQVNMKEMTNYRLVPPDSVRMYSKIDGLSI